MLGIGGPAVFAAGVGNPPAPGLLARVQERVQDSRTNLAYSKPREARAHPPWPPIWHRAAAYPIGFFGLRRLKMPIFPDFVAFFLVSVFQRLF